MFFRRHAPHEPSFEERLESLKHERFSIQPLEAGRVRVLRDGCAAIVGKDDAGRARILERVGLLMGDAIGTLIDGGYQKFIETPDGRRKPALAEELRAIHDFQEDLRESLGLKSLYNESLGTVSNRYLYDRVQDRDRGVPKRAWE
jgi:hypothetical protein